MYLSKSSLDKQTYKIKLLLGPEHSSILKASKQTQDDLTNF